MSGMSATMAVMQTAARKASRRLLRDFNEVEHLQIARKGPADFVSRADKMAEETIVEMLSEARPGYGFLLEEGGEIEGSDKTHRFIVDPLDGTTNFLHGIPHFAISIALEREIDGNPREIVAGMVYNPITDEMFMAEKGKGAFVNDGTRGGADRRVRPARRDIFQDSLFATGIPFWAVRVTQNSSKSFTKSWALPLAFAVWGPPASISSGQQQAAMTAFGNAASPLGMSPQASSSAKKLVALWRASQAATPPMTATLW